MHAVAQRAAKKDDSLVSTQFKRCTTTGFASVANREVAICLRPGTEIAFDGPVSYRRTFLMIFDIAWRTKKTVATFRKINADREDVHHDALEFADGTVVLVSKLKLDQSAKVLTLPADQASASKEVNASAETFGGATSEPRMHELA